MKRVIRVLNRIDKPLAMVIPLITILCLRAPAVQANFLVFMLLADLPRTCSSKHINIFFLFYFLGRRRPSLPSLLSRWTDLHIVMLSLALAVILLIAIFVRYVQSRRSFLQWSYHQGQSGSNLSQDGRPHPPRPTGTYDRWLLVRFTIALLVLW